MCEGVTQLLHQSLLYTAQSRLCGLNMCFFHLVTILLKNNLYTGRTVYRKVNIGNKPVSTFSKVVKKNGGWKI